jgi:putative Ca2+/H+ antiporter (TMEM165/GDT1 family)
MPLIDLRLFASTFSIIFVAELLDRTALTTMIMATRRHPMAVFIGVALAFLVQSIVAVLFGQVLTFLPEKYVKIFAGALFLVFAYHMWFKTTDEEESANEAKGVSQKSFSKVIGSSFLVIFIAEWGDLTQLATAALVAKYKAAFTIFVSSTLALWCVTGIAVFVGAHSKHLINPAKLQKFAAIIFTVIGVYFFIQAFRPQI